ncbi:MAG: DUF4397 domain-containing protein [Anaerolineae bacterium]|nr:DUF4397 domain-containing protein [Anaerolineae bacterium]
MTSKRSSLLMVLVVLLTLISGVSVRSANAAETGWLRVAHLIDGGTAVDVWIGDKAVLENVEPTKISDYQAVEAGEQTLTITPTGKGADAAILGPLTVNVTASHNYTVAAIGQATDKAATSLIVDETDAFKDIDPDTMSAALFINNLQGVPAVDIMADGKIWAKDIAYGSYAALAIPAQNFNDLVVTASGDPKTVFFESPVFYEPATRYITALVGSYPGEMGKDYDFVFPEGNSPRNMIDFLHGFSGVEVGFAKFPAEIPLPFDRQIFKFETLLAAIDKAGLTEMLTSGDYTLLAPTDAAFALLPADTLAQWTADPAKLMQFVRAHLITGGMSAEALFTAGTAKTLEGSELTFAPLGDMGGLSVNGDQAGCGCNYHVANGYVFVLDRVLTPQ